VLHLLDDDAPLGAGVLDDLADGLLERDDDQQAPAEKTNNRGGQNASSRLADE
jgi:hypothetical protein